MYVYFIYKNEREKRLKRKSQSQDQTESSDSLTKLCTTRVCTRISMSITFIYVCIFLFYFILFFARFLFFSGCILPCSTHLSRLEYEIYIPLLAHIYFIFLSVHLRSRRLFTTQRTLESCHRLFYCYAPSRSLSISLSLSVFSPYYYFSYPMASIAPATSRMHAGAKVLEQIPGDMGPHEYQHSSHSSELA